MTSKYSAGQSARCAVHRPRRQPALASARATWQVRDMADKRPTAAGGFLIALGILGGAGVGFAIGQATPGLLIGTAIGVAAALLVWIRDRR
jgi:hypothetical protein